MTSNCLLNSHGASLLQGLELGWQVGILREKAKDLYLQLAQFVEWQSSLSTVPANSAASQHIFTNDGFPSDDLAKSFSIWLVDVHLVGIYWAMTSSIFLSLSFFYGTRWQVSCVGLA